MDPSQQVQPQMMMQQQPEAGLYQANMADSANMNQPALMNQPAPIMNQPTQPAPTMGQLAPSMTQPAQNNGASGAVAIANAEAEEADER